MKYNSKQLECIKHSTSPLMILAGAGTGKTTTIVGRVADYIQSRNIDPKSILVLTYTVNSANQLKSKLKKIIGEKSDDIMAMNFHSFGNFVRFLYAKEGKPDKSPDRFSKTSDFKWFLDPPLPKPQHEFVYNRNGRLMVDFLGRFENYPKDSSYVLSILGVTSEKRDPIYKVNATSHSYYGTYYDEETRNMVKSIYKKDFEIFRYR